MADFVSRCLVDTKFPPRRQDVHFYMVHPEFIDKINAVVDAHWPVYQQENKLTNDQRITFYEKVARCMFSEESEDVRKRLAAENKA